MPTYNYRVGRENRAIIKGQIDAPDQYSAVDKLKKQGYYILQIKKTGMIGPFDTEKIKDDILSLAGAELKPLEKMMFTKTLAEMMKTGLPIIEAMSTFEEQGNSQRAKKMFKSIIADIRGGLPPSKAFAKYPKTFSILYTSVLESGESMGNMGETLSYLASELKKDNDLVSKVKSALIYPIVILVVMLVVMGFITIYVVPKITTFASNLGQELPMATKLLIDGSNFIMKYAPIIIGILVVGIIAFIRIINSEPGRKIYDKFLLKIPLIGLFIVKFNLSRFCRLLGAFQHYGISLPKAFDTLQASVSNYYYRVAVINIKNNVARGIALSEALEREDQFLFPKITSGVLRGAEKSAGVDEALWRLADYYETELETSLKNITTMIEPLMIVFLGVCVVALAVAVIVPIYKITVSFK
jgi:type IV pilus assembly protein PilC